MTENSNVPPIDDYHKIEAQKVFDAILAIQNLRAQYGVIFLSGNATLIGFAVNSRSALLFGFAGLLFLTFAAVDFSVRGTQLAYYFRAKQIQKQFAPNDRDSFVTLPLRQSVNLEQHLDEIAAMPSEEARTRALRRLPLKAPTAINLAIILMGLIEIVASLTLFLFFGWKLF